MVVNPLALLRSLTPIGMPASGPGSAPEAMLVVDGVRLVERPAPVEGDEGVVGAVEGLDPLERRLGQLPRADLFGAHRADEG